MIWLGMQRCWFYTISQSHAFKRTSFLTILLHSNCFFWHYCGLTSIFHHTSKTSRKSLCKETQGSAQNEPLLCEESILSEILMNRIYNEKMTLLKNIIWSSCFHFLFWDNLMCWSLVTHTTVVGPEEKEELFYRMSDEGERSIHHTLKNKERRDHRDQTENWEAAVVGLHNVLSYRCTVI